jgi:5-methylcytosine-specific restriction endonuclease McrA
MTLRPVEPIRLTIPPQDFPLPYDIPPQCQVPRCPRPWDHRHHIVPRSRTTGPKRYVAVDQIVLPNVCGLCFQHHENVTGVVGGHFAKIRVPTQDEIDLGLFTERCWLWYTRGPSVTLVPEWDYLGPLDPVVYL